MKTKLYDYHLYLDGVWGRNRSAKRQSFTISENNVDTLSLQVLSKITEVYMDKLKVKPGSSWKVKLAACDQETTDGVTFKTYTIKFGENNTVIEGVF